MSLDRLIGKGIPLFAVAFLALSACVPLLAAAPAAGTDIVTDVVVGRNNKGPYALSWSEVDPASVTVVLNGRTLKKGENFNVDTAKGLLSFTSVLLNDTIVRVSYKVVPGKSKQNTDKLNVPVTLNVFQRKDANLQVTGLYAQDDPRNPDAGKTVVGLGGEKTWGASKVNSQFFISQRNDDKDGSQQGGSWERSAFRVGTETGTGNVKFTGSLVHAGSEFAGGKETGLGAGKDSMNLAMTANPNKMVTFSASLQQSEDTAGKTKGNQSTVVQQNLNIKPTDATNVAITHTTTETATAAEGSDRKVDSTVAKVDQNLAGNTKASVSVETASITAGGKTDNVQTTSASVSTAPVQQVSVNVNTVQKNSESAGKQAQHNISTTIKPIEQVAVTASHSITEVNDTEQAKTNVSLKANPLKNTELTGNMAVQTTQDQEQFQRDLRITSKPVDFARFTAGMSQRGVNDDDDVTKSAAVELTPFAHTQVTAGYTQSEAGSRVMTIRDYAASTKPTNYFSVSGSVRDREVNNDQALDTRQVQVALAPLGIFTLTGAYESNPEDKKGQVQTYNATSVGLKTRFGSVGVTTGFSTKDEYMAQRTSEESQIGLEVPVFRNGKLTTGFKMSRYLDGSEYSTRTYSLGFSHSVGSRFNLALTGYYTNSMQNDMALPEKTNYSAEASLGLKF